MTPDWLEGFKNESFECRTKASETQRNKTSIGMDLSMIVLEVFPISWQGLVILPQIARELENTKYKKKINFTPRLVILFRAYMKFD